MTMLRVESNISPSDLGLLSEDFGPISFRSVPTVKGIVDGQEKYGYDYEVICNGKATREQLIEALEGLGVEVVE